MAHVHLQGNITKFTYIVIYEPASNGAYFLGELDKFVHVSPQRFDSVYETCSPDFHFHFRLGRVNFLLGTVNQFLALLGAVRVRNWHVWLGFHDGGLVVVVTTWATGAECSDVTSETPKGVDGASGAWAMSS